MKAPYAFTGFYGTCYDVPQMAMDRRHVYTIHAILSAWPFKSALELGSWHGASSTAFIEAINGGSAMQATFCDVQVSESLRAVTDNCRLPDRVQITNQPSWELLDTAQPFDFILVDANHDLASVTKEVDRLLLRRPLCIMAHDTSASVNGYPMAEGAEMLKRTFSHAPYHWIEDAKLRPKEETQRGLFCATTNPALFGIIREAFARYCPQEES